MLKPYLVKGIAPPKLPQKTHVLAWSTTTNENSSSRATANENTCVFLEVVKK